MTLDEAQQQMKKDMETLFRNTMINVCNDVVKDWPVDTGNSRGNWQGSLGSPVSNIISKTVAVGRVEDAKSTLSGWSFDQTAYFSNPTAYAEPLEYGWSNQAPNGVVRIKIGNAQAVLDREVEKLQGGN